MGIVYCGVCLHNNKKYIGSSVETLSERVRNHFRRHHNNEFYRDIDTYGRDGWLWGVVEDDIPEDNLRQREDYWIQHFGLDNLYNTRRGYRGSDETDYSRHKQKYLDRQREYLKRPEVRERRRLQRQRQYRERHPN